MKLREKLATKGFALEKRDKDDISISIGSRRLRFPKWSGYLLALLIVGFFVMQICALKWTGKPVPIKGVIEASRRTGSLTNRVGVVESTVIDHEKRIGVLEAK